MGIPSFVLQTKVCLTGAAIKKALQIKLSQPVDAPPAPDRGSLRLSR
jgi:hypothetical protein